MKIQLSSFLSAAAAAVVFLLGSNHMAVVGAQTEDRLARRMPLSMFQRLLYTAATEDDSPSNEQEWQASADLNWERALSLDRTEGRLYPFILCDDEETSSSDVVASSLDSIQRRREIASFALGLEVDEIVEFSGVDGLNSNNETLETYLDDNLEVIRNDPDLVCVMGSFNATRAAQLAPFIVQPISFLMKINSGSVGFVPNQEYNDGVLQYAVNWCKGVADQIDRALVLGLLQDIVPLVPLLVEIPEAARYKEELLILQQALQDNPTYCDPLIIDNVEAENEGGDSDDDDATFSGGIEYTLLTFTVDEQNRNPSASLCFNLFTFALAYAPEVCYIERRVEFETANLEAAWVTQSSIPRETPFYQSGLTGLNQIVSVSDTGLDLQSCYFRDTEGITYGRGSDPSRRKVVQYFDFVNRNEVRDGHGSHVAGTIAGQRSDDGVSVSDGFVDGIAYNAKLAFVDIGLDDASASLRVPGARTLMDPGRNAGAKIHSASWGSSSVTYNTMDEAIDEYLYANKDFLMIVAAGNEGPVDRTIRSPAGAKNVLTVGATQNEFGLGRLASFSSRGPSFDGRIKPDVVAPGQTVLSVGSRDNPSCDPESESDLPGGGQGTRDDNVGILSLQGTSMATPVVSGVGAQILQYFDEGWYGNGTKGSAPAMDLSGALLKAIIINGARPLNGYTISQVDSKQGFGRVSLIDTLPLKGTNDLSGDFLDYQIVMQGDVDVYNYNISSSEDCTSDAEFSVTLVWTDQPGNTACQKCLRTNLDLFVVQTKTDGSKVNHYPNGKDKADDLNNVERIRFTSAPGESFEASVRGAFLSNTFQTYALAVVSGCGNHRLEEGYGSSAGAKMGSFHVITLSLVAFVTTMVVWN
mmetsp:Transcript_4442/g.12358  ORF Transcript_4442/g.12358 Transcript_4442/m.12358 type:complete len:867 (+) Transcript_4442:1596-4196(+)